MCQSLRILKKMTSHEEWLKISIWTDPVCVLMQSSILSSSGFCWNGKPWLQSGNFKYIPVFNKLQCAALCTMNLRFSSILEFDSRKVGYLLRITVFFKNDNGAALPPQETWSPRCLYTLFTFKSSGDLKIGFLSAARQGGHWETRGQPMLFIWGV